MKIETKFNIGDEVWTLACNKIIKTKIIDYSFNKEYSVKEGSITPLEKIIGWKLEYKERSWIGEAHINKLETELFKTKEELIASL